MYYEGVPGYLMESMGEHCWAIWGWSIQAGWHKNIQNTVILVHWCQKEEMETDGYKTDQGSNRNPERPKCEKKKCKWLQQKRLEEIDCYPTAATKTLIFAVSTEKKINYTK